MASVLTPSPTESTAPSASSGSPGSPTPPSGSSPEPTPKRNRPKHHIALYVFLPPAILALSLIANGAYQARSRGNATAVAEKALARAIKRVPFEVRLPKNIPANSVMVRVFLDEPDSDQGFQAYQLNVWYRTLDASVEGGGVAMHIWQTNDKFLARRLADPMQMKGAEVEVAGQSWRQVTDARVTTDIVTTFSHRFDDGITMTVDSQDEGLAKRLIEELAVVPVV